MSSIMRWRSGLMGFSSIAKTPVSHGVEPHDLETVRTFAFVFSSLKLSASHRRNYRASGFVLTSTPAVAGQRSTAGFSLQVLWLRMLRRPRPLLNVVRCHETAPN